MAKTNILGTVYTVKMDDLRKKTARNPPPLSEA